MRESLFTAIYSLLTDVYSHGRSGRRLLLIRYAFYGAYPSYISCVVSTLGNYFICFFLTVFHRIGAWGNGLTSIPLMCACWVESTVRQSLSISNSQFCLRSSFFLLVKKKYVDP